MATAMHRDFWFEPAKLFRLSASARRTHLLTGSVNALIDAALADETGACLLIEAESGGMLVDREIARVACDLTRPRRLQPGEPGWYGGRIQLLDADSADDQASERTVREAETGAGRVTIVAARGSDVADDAALIAATTAHIQRHGLPADHVVRLDPGDFTTD